MMVERKELERNLGRTFVGFKFNIHMTNSHVRSIISSRFELIEALYTFLPKLSTSYSNLTCA